MKWWDESWNPSVGCTKCSPGCQNCYAESLHTQRYRAKRADKKVSGKCYDRPFNNVIQLLEERLEVPLHWKKPRSIFVCNMSDLFHPEVPFEFIDKVFAVMALCPQHTFLVLTKRADRMLKYFSDWDIRKAQRISVNPSTLEFALSRGTHLEIEGYTTERDLPLSNLWLGVTVCNQAEADEKIPLLLQTPAAHRFLSIEPMLEAIEIKSFPTVNNTGCPLNPLTGELLYGEEYIKGEKIDQVILGGETSKNARPLHPDWARTVRDDCKAAGVPFFMKQMSQRKPIPQDLQIMELAWQENKE